MIRTKDLEEFIKDGNFDVGYGELPRCDIKDIKGLYQEYCAEIVARLRAYDKLKESIEKLCRDLSNGIDK
jgi:hypothetical protein